MINQTVERNGSKDSHREFQVELMCLHLVETYLPTDHKRYAYLHFNYN